ncbi:MAG: Mur ligase domain-containing protein, partial [Mesonia sp.]
MILLKDILYRVSIESVIGDTNVAIQNIDFDSRKISLNDVFVAIRGEANDGHEFIAKAEENGAIA